MNIKQAKEEIKRTVYAYLQKDEFGGYRIPAVRQRPVLLIGAPGIGKTAIMEQIASETGIALAAYNMTHHTRQSAVGLPFIEKRTYEGREVAVTEYTMSEIIASVYEKREKSGVKEGILFLDEINCVSETLAPTMLQFLQNKTFGNEQLPEGWIIVAAGNPAEYNRSVREFDVVTLDRVKRMEVAADFAVWKEYAAGKKLHGSILSYLDIKRDDFYRIERTAEGLQFVTARAWEDLSDMLYAYERKAFPVEEALISQYLQHARIAKDFAAYYDLYYKYRSGYQIEEILNGHFTGDLPMRLKEAPFDEKLSVFGLLGDCLTREFSAVWEEKKCLSELFSLFKQAKERTLATVAEEWEKDGKKRLAAGSLTREERLRRQKIAAVVSDLILRIKEQGLQAEAAYELLKEEFRVKKDNLAEAAKQAGAHLTSVFTFLRASDIAGEEMVIFVTGLGMNPYSAWFIAEYGSADYEEYNRLLLVDETRESLRRRAKAQFE